MADPARIPPNHFEAEQSVLGSMLLSERCVFEALESVSESDFYHPQHRDIFRVMSDLAGEGIPVDLVTVAQRMEQTGKMRTGSAEYLVTLSSVVPSTANLKYYVDIIRHKASLRALIEVCAEINRECYESEDDARDIANRAASQILNIALKDNRSSMVHIKDALKETMVKFGAVLEKKKGLLGLPTGFPHMDNMLSGLQGGQLIVVAGRPGMGKTSFSMNMVQHIGLTQKATCLVFSLEMSADQLAGRMLCAEARIDSQITRTGVGATQNVLMKMGEAMKVLSNTQIFVDDSSVVNTSEMLAKAQNLKRRGALDIVMIDYLQLMQGTRRTENRQQEISQITRTLKIMAKELNVPILLLSQLSRASEKSERRSKMPMLSDLRESGAIEQDADVVIFLHREDYYPEDRTPENLGKARVIIAKQRSGPTGYIQMQWNGEYTKYVEVDVVHDGEEAEH